jgi:AAA family ATP:ADP antiporter
MLVALIAGLVIATYAKYTVNISIVRLILWTNAVILSNIIFFWVVLSYFDSAWSRYAFYIWSAMVTVIGIAQAWTFANHIFTEEEGKRCFGLIAAGGTVGGIVASFGAKWMTYLSIESTDLLWVIASGYITASVLMIWAEAWLEKKSAGGGPSNAETEKMTAESGLGQLLSGSGYLKTVALIILVSVIVSTLIDFNFKVGAKEAYPSAPELAGFFSLYYGWLNMSTLFVQVFITGRILGKLGLAPSLYVSPGALLTGAMAIIIWPGLVPAMLTRMGDTVLRNSIHRSAMEVVYMAVPPGVVRTVKTFLDVVVERLGDASAGFIILWFSLVSMEKYVAYVHLICVGLILTWLALTRFLRTRYAEVFRERVTLQEPALCRSWLENE